jgi:hypothetical protein
MVFNVHIHHTLSIVFFFEYLNIQQKSQHVIESSQLRTPFPLCLVVNEVMKASCATSWFLESDLEDPRFFAPTQE